METLNVFALLTKNFIDCEKFSTVESHYKISVALDNLETKGMINIQDKILEFIHRRFPTDSNWTCQNCYFFALILHNVFGGSIWYEVISGHFVTLIDGKYYDWSGEIKTDGYLVEWDKFDEYDSLQKQVIIRDCIM